MLALRNPDPTVCCSCLKSLSSDHLEKEVCAHLPVPALTLAHARMQTEEAEDGLDQCVLNCNAHHTVQEPCPGADPAVCTPGKLAAWCCRVVNPTFSLPVLKLREDLSSQNRPLQFPFLENHLTLEGRLSFQSLLAGALSLEN